MSCKCKECKCEKSQSESNQDNSTIIPDEIISETPNDMKAGEKFGEGFNHNELEKIKLEINTINKDCFK